MKALALVVCVLACLYFNEGHWAEAFFLMLCAFWLMYFSKQREKI